MYNSGSYFRTKSRWLLAWNVMEIRNTLYTSILSTLLLFERAENFFSFSSPPPPPPLTLFSILFSSGSSFYFLLSVSRLVPLFRIQDAVSKSNYYGGTLGCGEGRMGRGGLEYMSIRGRMEGPPLRFQTSGKRKDYRHPKSSTT